ncbi:MAG: hypothetical protein IJT62_09165 [Oscillospiraceae bacterium]|nr:hypothetical protein [Oscillospiraceae bacterium]
MNEKPILFNGEMVSAILDGRKTATRRLISRKRVWDLLSSEARKNNPDISDQAMINMFLRPPCEPGDILYVRETWQYGGPLDGNDQMIEPGRYYYAADGDPFDRWLNDDGTVHEGMKWRPSIHMPKEAARIWLRVGSVQAELLQSITEDGARREGIGEYFVGMGESGFAVNRDSSSIYETARGAFADLWNSTIKNTDKWWASWGVNPWVWAIEFERCEKPGGEP